MSRRTALAATHAMLVKRQAANFDLAAYADENGFRTVRDRASARAEAYRTALQEFERICAEHVKED